MDDSRTESSSTSYLFALSLLHSDTCQKTCSKKGVTRTSHCLLHFLLMSIFTSTLATGVVDDGEFGCSMPLGLTSGKIKDWQLAASSAISRAQDPDCAVKHARLHRTGSKAWCAAPSSNSQQEWILVDLGVTSSTISGIVTQGRVAKEEWVTHFSVSYSDDAFKWEFARDIYGHKKVFKGNVDSFSLKHAYLEHPVRARFIRIHITDWHHHPSLRLELIGCQVCNDVISMLPYTAITASSPHTNRRKKQTTCAPQLGDLSSAQGWCPRRRQKDSEWLQFDLGPPTTITGLITRGQGDKKRFVTSYSMSYSNDTHVWFFYKDSNHLEPKVFGGNMDKVTERRHYLNQPVVARFIRFHPITWHKRRIGMRAGVLGCPHKGPCGQGFMRVNYGSSCVANKAYDKTTWILNDKRHSWNEWSYGHSSLAVDGNLDASLANCAIMDNYFIDEPIWMVDLGSKRSQVDGVVILTWQGAGQDKLTAYTDYVHSLERITVYVSDKKKSADFSDDQRPSTAFKKCSSVSKLNNALFNPRLHFDCPETLLGRYVYVKASGVPDRWRKLFTVILCEVMVY